MSAPTAHKKLLEWVESTAALTTPDRIYWCNGSQEESDRLFNEMIEAGVGHCIKLSRPGCYYFRTDKGDTARREAVTYIVCENKNDAGPTNNWVAPAEMRERIATSFKGCMAGRTMYVIPFCMGPLGSPMSRIGVEISDSPYVVVNMRVLARIGTPVLDVLGNDGKFVPCLHSVGYPLRKADGTVVPDVPWPCNLEKTFIAHFTDGEPFVAAFSSAYGGNSLLNKKCLALRIGSVMARKEGWLAEHMLISGVTDDQGNKTYVTAAFPSACGKTNFAMLTPPPELVAKGWSVSTLGDDIAWLQPRDGRLYAVNAEAGFFGVAPGTNLATNPVAMACVQRDTIFTNVAYNPATNDVWWEGMEVDGPVPERLIDWLGNEWTPGCGRPAAHSNSRFTAPIQNCPTLDPAWNDPRGVPISVIIYGGRRATDMPLVFQSFHWAAGVYAGATVCSESTSAQLDVKEGMLRNDPFAMIPFMGYNAGDYIAHELRMGRALRHKPIIAHVNWFRRAADKSFLWNGYGDNMRVLQWLVKRAQGRVGARETALGWVPRYQDMDWDGMAMDLAQWRELMRVDPTGLRERTLLNHEQLLVRLGERAPRAMWIEKDALLQRLTENDLPEAARKAAEGNPDDEEMPVPAPATSSAAGKAKPSAVCMATCCGVPCLCKMGGEDNKEDERDVKAKHAIPKTSAGKEVVKSVPVDASACVPSEKSHISGQL